MSEPAATPAFKEWAAIVGALGAGVQTIILRKGGIAEGRAGFRPEHDRFWLFPTLFHQQGEKTKPEAARFLADAAGQVGLAGSGLAGIELAGTGQAVKGGGHPESVTIQYGCLLEETFHVDDWEAVTRLNAHHLWSEATIRERFDYGATPGLHVLLVRVQRRAHPETLPWRPAFQGCKSWTTLPLGWSDTQVTPVLEEEDFARRAGEIRSALAR